MNKRMIIDLLSPPLFNFALRLLICYWWIVCFMIFCYADAGSGKCSVQVWSQSLFTSHSLMRELCPVKFCASVITICILLLFGDAGFGSWTVVVMLVLVHEQMSWTPFVVPSFSDRKFSKFASSPDSKKEVHFWSLNSCESSLLILEFCSV
jgi:hypothetical protein